jgi:hypothetical protein
LTDVLANGEEGIVANNALAGRPDHPNERPRLDSNLRPAD